MTETAPNEQPNRHTLFGDSNGRSLVSVYTWADDSFQIVDERGGNRTVILDTHEKPRQAAPKKLEAFA